MRINICMSTNDDTLQVPCAQSTHTGCPRQFVFQQSIGPLFCLLQQLEKGPCSFVDSLSTEAFCWVSRRPPILSDELHVFEATNIMQGLLLWTNPNWLRPVAPRIYVSTAGSSIQHQCTSVLTSVVEARWEVSGVSAYNCRDTVQFAKFAKFKFTHFNGDTKILSQDFKEPCEPKAGEFSQQRKWNELENTAAISWFGCSFDRRDLTSESAQEAFWNTGIDVF